MATCVARADGRTGDACWFVAASRRTPLEEVVRHRIGELRSNGMNSCAPSTNCWKASTDNREKRQGSGKSVDNDEIAANLESI